MVKKVLIGVLIALLCAGVVGVAVHFSVDPINNKIGPKTVESAEAEPIEATLTKIKTGDVLSGFAFNKSLSNAQITRVLSQLDFNTNEVGPDDGDYIEMGIVSMGYLCLVESSSGEDLIQVIKYTFSDGVETYVLLGDNDNFNYDESAGQMVAGEGFGCFISDRFPAFEHYFIDKPGFYGSDTVVFEGGSSEVGQLNQAEKWNGILFSPVYGTLPIGAAARDGMYVSKVIVDPTVSPLGFSSMNDYVHELASSGNTSPCLFNGDEFTVAIGNDDVADYFVFLSEHLNGTVIMWRESEFTFSDGSVFLSGWSYATSWDEENHPATFAHITEKMEFDCLGYIERVDSSFAPLNGNVIGFTEASAISAEIQGFDTNYVVGQDVSSAFNGVSGIVNLNNGESLSVSVEHEGDLDVSAPGGYTMTFRVCDQNVYVNYYVEAAPETLSLTSFEVGQTINGVVINTEGVVSGYSSLDDWLTAFDFTSDDVHRLVDPMGDSSGIIAVGGSAAGSPTLIIMGIVPVYYALDSYVSDGLTIPKGWSYMDESTGQAVSFSGSRQVDFAPGAEISITAIDGLFGALNGSVLGAIVQ